MQPAREENPPPHSDDGLLKTSRLGGATRSRPTRSDRRFQVRHVSYPEGWSRNRLADPLLQARAAYCIELSRLPLDELAADLQTLIAVVIEIKVARSLAEIGRAA
jgi:hypothetical protein